VDFVVDQVSGKALAVVSYKLFGTLKKIISVFGTLKTVGLKRRYIWMLFVTSLCVCD